MRTTGLGMATGLGRMGGIFIPWIAFYLAKINLFSPFLLFAFLSFFTALVDMWLPYDTTGVALDSFSAK